MVVDGVAVVDSGGGFGFGHKRETGVPSHCSGST